jgi:hypothetical protein
MIISRRRGFDERDELTARGENPKHEARNPKQIQSQRKYKCSKRGFEISSI